MPYEYFETREEPNGKHGMSSGAFRATRERPRIRIAHIPHTDLRCGWSAVFLLLAGPHGAGSITCWLCFQGDLEKRRLVPIPDDWSHCPTERLELYCEQATRLADHYG